MHFSFDAGTAPWLGLSVTNLVGNISTKLPIKALILALL